MSESMFLNVFTMKNLSIIEIMDYIKGEKLIDANHVVFCGVKERNAGGLTVMATCIPSTSIRNSPYEVEVYLTTTRELKVTCSCKAGLSGFCKHGIAILLYINRVSLDNLEDLSQTDLKQGWGKVKCHTSLYQPTEITQLCHVKNHVDVMHEVNLDIMNDIMSAVPQSSLFIHSTRKRADSRILKVADTNHSPSGAEVVCISSSSAIDILFTTQVKDTEFSQKEFHYIQKLDEVKLRIKYFHFEELPVSQKMFYRSMVELTVEEAKNLCSKTIAQQEEEWFMNRMLRITGTTCYSLFTCRETDSNKWENKIRKMLSSSFSGNAATRYGTEMEPIAREHYKMHNCSVEELGLLVNPIITWLGFSPDGVVFDGSGYPSKLLEIKSPFQAKSADLMELVRNKTLEYLVVENESLLLKKRHKYFAQCQLGLFITNLEVCDIVIYSNTAPLLIVNVT